LLRAARALKLKTDNAVILAIENCAPGEYVRYLAPSNATDDEIALVKRMGAAPYGTKHPSPCPSSLRRRTDIVFLGALNEAKV
jgi:hypothetical protein